jgi:hypothetical protein
MYVEVYLVIEPVDSAAQFISVGVFKNAKKRTVRNDAHRTGLKFGGPDVVVSWITLERAIQHSFVPIIIGVKNPL